MGKNWIPEDRYIPAKGIKRFVKSRQCAAMYSKGGRAGKQCTWYAQADRIYCARHGRNVAPKNVEAWREGNRNWWIRLKALEAKYPGIMRQALGVDKAIATRKAIKEVEKTMPKPETEDKTILQAHKAIVKRVADLPALPDKPFEDMEPHEQLVAITGQSLKVVHEILSFEMTEGKGKNKTVNLKVASMVKDTALRALAVRLKSDRNALTARRLDKMGELLERLRNGDDAKIIDGTS